MKHLIRSTLATLCLASASLAVPALAHAADGYVTGNVNLRAGPDIDYPLIDIIPAGTEVNVQGCTQGWEWCDVIVYGNRGWVVGNYVEYEYQNRPVLLPAYGARIGIPIVTFVIGSYWDNHYRSRPFYRQRSHWYRRPIVRRPPPPPMRHPYRPRAPVHGVPGHGRPPMHRPRPPVSHRPMPSRPATPARPARPPSHGHPPAPNTGARPARPAHNQRPQPVKSPPAARPIQHAPSRVNHPAQSSGRAQPSRSHQGESRSADKKDGRRGH